MENGNEGRQCFQQRTKREHETMAGAQLLLSVYVERLWFISEVE